MMRDSALRPTGRRRYMMGEHGQSEQTGRQGDYVCKPGRAVTWGPSYQAGGTTIRILPARNPEDPTVWDPYRFSAEKNQFGDWIRRYPAVRGMGDPGVTFITHDPADQNASPDAGDMTPGWLLYRAIDKAVNQGQDRPGWAAMLKGGTGRRALLPKPSEIYLVQAVIVQNKGKAYTPPKGFEPDSKAIVFQLSRSAGLALIDACNKLKEGYQGAPDDYEQMMLNGDPVSLSHGRFAHFYSLEAGNPNQRGNAGGWDSAPAAADRGGFTEKGYGCEMYDHFGNMQPSLLAYESIIATKVQPWDEILYFPTVAEQAQLLADKFPAEVICYAWRDHPEWIPESVVRKAANAHSVDMGGYGVVPPPAQPGWGTPGHGNPAFPQGTVPPQSMASQGPPAGPPSFAPPSGPPATTTPPTQQPAAQAAQQAMAWGMQPNPVGQQAAPTTVVDPAMPPTGMPPGAAVTPAPMTPTIPVNPPAQQPAEATGGLSSAQMALQRARAVHGRS